MSVIWSDVHQKNYIRLYNTLTKSKPSFFKDTNKETYLDKINKKELLRFINKLELSNSSKETLFFMIARFYEYHKVDTSFIQQFKQAGYNLKVKREKTDGDNQLDEKETKGFIKYELLKQIADNIDYENIETKKEHMKYLLLKLLIYNPLRTNYYYTAEFSKGKTEKDKNYMLLLTLAGKQRAILHIGKDKVSKTKYFNNEEKKNIEIYDNGLIKLIYDSLNKYPRELLITNEKGDKVSDKTILTYLRQITNNKNINVDMLRSAFITHQYNKKLTYNQKKEIADRLRHSITTGQLRYLKNIDEDEKNKSEEDYNVLVNENNRLKLQIEELKKKLNDYDNIFENAKNKKSQKLIENEEELKQEQKLFRKRKLDYIFKLNNNKVNKPNEKLLNFYGIKFNEENKTYY